MDVLRQIQTSEELKNADADDLSDFEERKSVLIETTMENYDIKDPLLNLPSNWSQLDFERKKSCILSHIYSTSVNKAISHLEALQNAIDEWIDRENIKDNKFTSSANSKKVLDLVRVKNGGKKGELRFTLTPILHPYDENKFEIRGVGAKNNTIIEKPSDMIVEKRPESQENLRAGGVLEEVLIILARLEHDRRRTEIILKKERENVVSLKSQIERWALKRITELPIMVQKEHEACVTDITELHWHIAFNTKTEERLSHKVAVAEKFKAQLQEEIDNINQSTPLIEEKISLELKVIQTILQAQKETTDQLMKANERLSDIHAKNLLAHSKAQKETDELNADLAQCRRELNKSKKRLLEANDTTKLLIKKYEESHSDLSNNLKQENTEVDRRERFREKHTRLTIDSAHIETERFTLKKQIDSATYDNEGLNNRIMILTKKFSEELAQLNEVLLKKEDKLEKINKKIHEKEISIEEMEKDRQNILINIQKEEKIRDRLNKDREKNEQQLVIVSEGYDRAVQINESVVTDVSKEKKKYEEKEEAMQRNIIEVKKQLLDEKHQLSVLTTRLQNEIEEYNASIVDSRVKKQQYEKRKADLEERLVELEKNVKELDVRRHDVDTRIEVLKKDVAQLKITHEKVESEWNAKIQEREPKKSEKLKELDEKTKKVQHMKEHSKEMNEKMVTMAENKAVMEKTIEKTNEEIDILSEIANEITIQCNSTGSLDEHLQNGLDDILERDHRYDRQHNDHIKERRLYNLDLENSIKLALEENKELASKYRQTKYDMYMKKLQYFLRIEKGLEVFAKVKDKRQLQLLQIRMHKALEDYFNIQVQFGKQNFGKLNSQTSQNNEKLFGLEDSFHVSVERISDFLKNQMDFSLVRQQAMQKVQREELELEYNQQKSANKKPKVNFKLENQVN